MKILNLSLDPHLLDPESVVSIRARMYGKKAGKYTSVVPTPATRRVELSEESVVYGSGGINKIVRLVKLILVVRRLVRKGEVEVITSQDAYFLGLTGLYFARRYHLGLEIQILGLEKLSWFRLRLARFVLNRASVVRVLSTALIGRLEREFGVSRDRMKFVPIYVPVDKLGLDLRTLEPTEQRQYDALSRDFDARYGKCINFLNINRLVPIKRIELQLEAMAKIKDSHPNVRLHIVGDGPERARIEKLVTSLGVEQCVIIHGAKYALELGIMYTKCDCFLLTSDYEGFGMVIVEAFTAGLPVIMTDVGCAGDLAIDGENALIVPVGDGEAIRQAVVRIAEDTDLRNRLSEGALRAVKRIPTLESILNDYLGLWERAWANKL